MDGETDMSVSETYPGGEKCLCESTTGLSRLTQTTESKIVVGTLSQGGFTVICDNVKKRVHFFVMCDERVYL